jgi:hypothetical protein
LNSNIREGFIILSNLIEFHMKFGKFRIQMN